jgi:hypothetical protein
VCPRERLVIISYTTGLSFALEMIGPLAAIITTRKRDRALQRVHKKINFS